MPRRRDRTSTVVVSALLLLASSPALAAPSCDGISPVSTSSLARATIVSGLTGRPLFVTVPPGDTTRIFIVEQNGTIRYWLRGDPSTMTTLFLNVTSRLTSGGDEQGLLGLAFDPDFETNGLFYIKYTRTDGDTVVARYRTLDGTPSTLGDFASETILLRIDQPQANHNGGMLAFGPDGYLYIATGDGGGIGDNHGPCGNGQNNETLLGKILRIDPHGISGNVPDCGLDPILYTIPSSNPLADGAGGDCDEIWAWGLRNPWRLSFDEASGDLYIGDVGQGCWEEIDYAPAASAGGENYGWRLFEGRHCYNANMGCAAANSPAGCGPACSDPAPGGNAVPNGTVLPIWELSHGGNCSITGGYVYRGCRMPGFAGTYFYGDYCAGSVLSFEVVAGAATNHRNWTASLGALLAFNLTSFGTDAEGEIYITRRAGHVLKIVPPLPAMETSGIGAQPLRLDAGNWTWENVQFSSGHPITAYRVYRAEVLDGIFDLGETFRCVLSTTDASWSGDPQDPLPGEMYAYVVVARNAIDEQTSPGGNPPRTLSSDPCPF